MARVPVKVLTQRKTWDSTVSFFLVIDGCGRPRVDLQHWTTCKVSIVTDDEFPRTLERAGARPPEEQALASKVWVFCRVLPAEPFSHP